jgi:hypothetical protein
VARESGCCGEKLFVEVPDEPTRSFLESEYDDLATYAVNSFGIREVCYVVRSAAPPGEVEASSCRQSPV